MRRRRARRSTASLLLALAALLPTSASAQTLEEILARHVAARGGAERIAAITSLRMTGKARGRRGRELLLVREIARPGRIRLEFTSDGMTGVFAFDGEQGWQISPFDGELEPRAMDPQNELLAAYHAEIGGPLVDAQSKGHRLELAGRASVDGRDAWKLELTPEHGGVRHLYLDAESYLQVRTETTREIRGRQLGLQASFGDYRETAGVLFPHVIEIGVERRPRSLKIVVESVEVNPQIDETRFRAPWN